jgi:hypothetical protein
MIAFATSGIASVQAMPRNADVMIQTIRRAKRRKYGRRRHSAVCRMADLLKGRTERTPAPGG